MAYRDSEEFARLCARAEELFARVGGEPLPTAFLNPAEQYFLAQYLQKRGLSDRAVFFGGAAGTERNKLFALPGYLTALAEGGDLCETVRTFLGEDAFADVCTLKIAGGGFRALSHRDYLGGILALGIDRGAVGDILPIDAYSAYVFVSRKVAAFLCGDGIPDGVRIANDRVKITRASLPRDYRAERAYREITDTVASARLDAVVAALCNLSREGAKEKILCGDVEQNYDTAAEISAPVNAGDILSVRGSGKFAVVSVTDPTKKGRFRLLAKKYL